MCMVLVRVYGAHACIVSQASGERNDNIRIRRIESKLAAKTKEPKETQHEMHALAFSLLSAAVDNGTNIQYDRFIFSFFKFNPFIAVSGVFY